MPPAEKRNTSRTSKPNDGKSPAKRKTLTTLLDKQHKSDKSGTINQMTEETKSFDKTPIILGLLTLFGVLAVGFMQYGLPFFNKPSPPENRRLQIAVLTDSGQPVKDAKVTVQYMQETPLVRATTSEGTCSFDLPGSVRNVSISVDKASFQFYSREALVTDRLEEIRLQPIVEKIVGPNTNTAGSNRENGSSEKSVKVTPSRNSSQKKLGSRSSGITQKQTNTNKSAQVVGNNANIVIH